MAHFAELDENNIVRRVIVVSDEYEETGEEWCKSLLGGYAWKKTSYNTVGGVHRTGGTPFRKNYAGINYTYDSVRDAFIAPQPFSSWILNEDTCLWDPPVPKPDDGKFYIWVESAGQGQWVELPGV